MRKVYLAPILLLVFTLFCTETRASHLLGADVTYDCVAPNVYEVQLQLYRDCSGITPSSNQTATVSSATCGASFTVNLSLLTPPTDITPICPGLNSGCGSNGPYGIESYIYTGTITLPPGCGDDWVIGWSQCCRNAAINTLTNPDNQDMYVQANLDNTISPVCNSSPVFNNGPGSIVCINQPVIYNHAVVDPDGDSLFFAFGDCFQSATTNVAYSGGFNGTTPLTTLAGVNINSSTGAITFTPTAIQIGVLCVVVEEYRNGVLIGTVNRDMQFSVINCTNIPPEATGINGTPSTNPVNFVTNICQGGEVCFTIDMTDPNMNNVTASWNNEIPAATFTVANNGTVSPIGTFCWTPTVADIGANVFTVNLIDDNCPIVGNATYTYSVEVVLPPYTLDAGMDQNICTGETVPLMASSSIPATSYTWSPATWLSTTNGTATDASPPITSVYSVAAEFPDGCVLQDEVSVNVLPDPDVTISPQDIFTCSGQNSVLTAVAPTATSFLWNTTDMTNIISVSPTTTTDYWVEVTNSQGCSNSDTATVSIAQPSSAACNVLYVSTTGSSAGNGSQASPYDLQTALTEGACNNTVIKMATGTYNTDTAITNITSYITLEGGFDETVAWEKVSTAGATRILRTATANTSMLENVDDANGNSPRVIAIQVSNQTGFRFQDLTVEVEDLEGTTIGLRGISTYGIYLNACDDYNFTRTQVLAGDASDGGAGTDGNLLNTLSGLNGQDGGDGGSGICDGGGVTNTGGTGGFGGFNLPSGTSPGTSSTGIFGAGGGFGGDGGDPGNNDALDGTDGGDSDAGAGGGGGGRGAQADPGGDGAIGANGASGAAGVIGAAGPAGTFTSGFFVPGDQGTNGTNGEGGSGGGGGGGGGSQNVLINLFDGAGNAGGGGGGGGNGGAGGSGGFGGGGSFGIFLANCGAGQIEDNFIEAGNPGDGGPGGNGGPGGLGGDGGAGNNFCSDEIGEGGDGGNGGNGGNGGQGGPGNVGIAADIYIDGGMLPTYIIDGSIVTLSQGESNPARFDLAAQPTIRMSDVSCTNSNVDFTGAAAPWNLGANSLPNGPNGAMVTTMYTAIGRKNISQGTNDYTGFTNIILDAGTPLTIETSIPIVQNTYRLCAGDSATFTAIGGGIGYIYNWEFSGPSAPLPPLNSFNTTNATTNPFTFDTPGMHFITLNFSSNCCGSSAADTLFFNVEEQPDLISTPSMATVCLGQNTPIAINIDDQISFGSITWSPSLGLDNNNQFDVNALPIANTTYNVVVSDSTGYCVAAENVVVEVVDLQLNVVTTAANCGPDGSAMVSVSGGSGVYLYQWNDMANQNTATATGLQIGTYLVYVTDIMHGCTDSAFAVIGGTAPVGFIAGGNSVSCSGGSDGTLVAGVVNGTAPYTYAWSPMGGNMATTTPLPSGTYSCTISDDNGCTYIVTGFIPEPAPLSITVDSTLDATCDAAMDGYAAVVVDGGSGSYTYLWDDPATQSTSFASNLSSGTYCVTVTDGAGCTDSICLVVESPDVIDTIYDTICAGQSYVFPAGMTFNATIDTSSLDTLITSVGCDSVMQTFLTVNPIYSDTIRSIICEGDAFTSPQGNMFIPISDTSFIDNFPTINGCDSIFVVELNLNETVPITIDTTICAGDMLTVNGITYMDAGNYSDTTQYVLSGCDSALYDITLHIDSFETVLIDTSLCAGDSILVNGISYGTAGNYFDTAVYSGSGCDSLRWEINVLIDDVFVENIDTAICAGDVIMVNGTMYNNTGMFGDTISYTGSGCDSLIYAITIQVDSAQDVLIDTTICEGDMFVVNGISYTSSGNFADTVTYVGSGCDSMRYDITLTIDSAETILIDTTICGGDFIAVNGVNYNTTGMFNDTIFHNSSGCDSLRYTINLVVDEAQDTVVNSAICAGDSVVVNGVSYNATGSYFDTTFYASGCDLLRYTINLMVNPLPNVVANTSDADSTVCDNELITLFGSGTGGVMYTWDNNVTDNIDFNPPIGLSTYIVTGMDANSCVAMDTISITGNASYSLNVNASICADTSYMLPDGTNVNVSGTYITLLTAANGCDSTITTVLNVNLLGSFTPVEDVAVCSGFSESFDVDGINISSYEWFVNEGAGYVSLLDSVTYSGADSDELIVPLDTMKNGNSYLLNMVDACGNVLRDTVNLEVYAPHGLENPIDDTTFCEHEIEVVTVNYNGYNYEWDDGSFGTSILPVASGDYIVNFVENGTNCLLSDTINITIEDCIANCVLLAPTGFSPDGNGTNDVFRAVSTCDEGYSSYSFTVYNRWGNLVYSTTNPEEGWDGTIFGNKAPIGTYLYYIEFQKNLSNKRETLKGNVTLVR